MNYKSLSKKELVEILSNLKELLDNPMQNNVIKTANNRGGNHDKKNDLESLIGTIPFLLHNRHIFERNQDIADFAERLKINIPSPDKKKREDIIGRVISAIAEFDTLKIRELNRVIETVKKSDIKKGKSNFFSDWEKAIKDMNL